MRGFLGNPKQSLKQIALAVKPSSIFFFKLIKVKKMFRQIVDSHLKIENESANPDKIDAKTSTNITKQKESTSKVFHCQDCPYTTDQICRLQKHENKHLVKAEHQVCSMIFFQS